MDLPIDGSHGEEETNYISDQLQSFLNNCTYAAILSHAEYKINQTRSFEPSETNFPSVVCSAYWFPLTLLEPG